MPTPMQKNYLYQVIVDVRRGQLFSFADDLSQMINCSTNAKIVFQRILISLAREYHFDEEKGFPEDKDGSGWKALCVFWDLCQAWDLPDKEFFAQVNSISNHIDIINDVDIFLNKFRGGSCHLYWDAMKGAFHRRVLRASQ